MKYDFCFHVQKQRAVVCTLNKDLSFVHRTRDMGRSLEQNHNMLVEAFEKLSYRNNEKKIIDRAVGIFGIVDV